MDAGGGVNSTLLNHEVPYDFVCMSNILEVTDLFFVSVFIFTLIFVEAEDTNGDKDISENSHPVLLMEDEANFSAIPCGISAECQLINDPLKLESNFEEDEGMLPNQFYFCVSKIKTCILCFL